MHINNYNNRYVALMNSNDRVSNGRDHSQIGRRSNNSITSQKEAQAINQIEDFLHTRIKGAHEIPMNKSQIHQRYLRNYQIQKVEPSNSRSS